MKKVLVLGGYGTVGTHVVKDLVESGFFVGIAGRNEKKIEELREKIGKENTKTHILDFSSEEKLISEMSDYEVIVNCLEYTFNQFIIDACIKSGKNYVDLGDYYEGILESRSKDEKMKKSGISAVLGAGSSPGIINVMISHITKNKSQVKNVVISFSDILRQEVDEKMLPFNFQTVVEEIIGEALAYENGKYIFVPGATKSMEVDFGEEFGKAECYITNHDEQYSIPVFLKDKGIENCYFVMNHNPFYLKLVPLLKELGVFEKEIVKVGNTEVDISETIHSYMKKFLPAGFKNDDREILFAKADDVSIGVINNSVDGVPAGIMNTAIGASLITQFLANHEVSAGIHHPEDFVNSDWMISELKKRGFEIQINGENI